MATATSHFVLAVSSFVGCISHFILGHIVWKPAIGIGFGAVIGAQIGAVISQKTRPRVIVILLSIVMCGLGLKLIFLSNVL